MTATGARTYGTEAEWQAVIARARAVPAYLATAERQLAAGVARTRPPDWRVLREFGLQSSAADADYFAKTLPQIAATDISSPHREALLHDLRGAGNDAAAAYRHLRDFVAGSFFDDVHAEGRAALKALLPRRPLRVRRGRVRLGAAQQPAGERQCERAVRLLLADRAGDPRARWSRSRSRSPPRTSGRAGRWCAHRAPGVRAAEPERPAHR